MNNLKYTFYIYKRGSASTKSASYTFYRDCPIRARKPTSVTIRRKTRDGEERVKFLNFDCMPEHEQNAICKNFKHWAKRYCIVNTDFDPQHDSLIEL